MTSVTLIVRLSVDAAGRLTGVVERVRTGEKQRFHGVEALGPLVERMAKGDSVGLEDATGGTS